MRESGVQANIIKRIKREFPGAIVLKNDPNYIQGIPDLLVLNGPTWAGLEVKRSDREPVQPNQAYYVSKMNEMAYASFIYPAIEDLVFDELQSAFQLKR